MNSFKPTPGPWDWFTNQVLQPDGTYKRVKEQTRDLQMKYLIGANGQGFAHTVGLGEPEDASNLRLLVAAFRMLERLEAHVARCPMCSAGTECQDDECYRDRVIIGEIKDGAQ